MPLLVVPLGVEEAGLLTLDELDALTHCERVWFERPDHPIVERLSALGVACLPFDDEPSAESENCALVCDPDSARVLELARAGATVTSGAVESPDSLARAHGAPVVRGASSSLGALVTVMARLRSADGCPWDREQSHESLAMHLLEEAHEVIDAINNETHGPELCEELGDVLLQVVFHARIAEQDGRFDIAEVADRLVAKLIHRHPHVFGETIVADANEVVRNWETIKRSEKGRSDPFADLQSSLPALLLAYKTQKRGAQLGWSATESDAVAKVLTALGEGDVGAALFWVVAVARARGVDPETALLGSLARWRNDLVGRA